MYICWLSNVYIVILTVEFKGFSILLVVPRCWICFGRNKIYFTVSISLLIVSLMSVNLIFTGGRFYYFLDFQCFSLAFQSKILFWIWSVYYFSTKIITFVSYIYMKFLEKYIWYVYCRFFITQNKWSYKLVFMAYLELVMWKF